MKKCTNCQTVLKDDARFCTNCGHPISEINHDNVEEQPTIPTNNSKQEHNSDNTQKRESTLKESIDKIRNKILDFLYSNETTAFLVNNAGVLISIAPFYAILRHLPGINVLYSNTLANLFNVFQSIGLILCLIDLRHAAFACFFALKGVDILIEELVRFINICSTYGDYIKSLSELSRYYSISSDTMYVFVFCVICFAIAISNYKKERLEYK